MSGLATRTSAVMLSASSRLERVAGHDSQHFYSVFLLCIVKYLQCTRIPPEIELSLSAFVQVGWSYEAASF